MSEDELADDFGTPILVYTRAQALADGMLIDVSAAARRAGIVVPVAVTEAAWRDCVAWSEADSVRQVPQEEAGRLWDLLFLARVALAQINGYGGEVRYKLRRVPRDGQSVRASATRLKLVLGPGDAGEPVLTVMLPEED